MRRLPARQPAGRGRLIPIAAAATLAFVAAVARAQAPASGEMPGHFLGHSPVLVDAVRRRCLELGDDTYGKDVPQVGACANLGFTSLVAAGGHRWYSALFGRRWLLTDSARTPADTAAESEIVLFTADSEQRSGRDTLVTPVWHYRFEPEVLGSVTPEIASVGGGALVGIDECVNGTGGCAQSFFLLRGDRWRVVRLAFVDSLNRRFPGAINHGFHVDVKTLRASAAVYSPGDANCCPSRVADMRLRLRGDALEIVELRVRASNETESGEVSGWHFGQVRPTGRNRLIHELDE